MYGAQAVWVGTRFVASEEAGAPKKHKELYVKRPPFQLLFSSLFTDAWFLRIVSAGHEDIARTLIYTGRPLRVRKTPYVADWEENRREEIKELTSKGIIPNEHEMEKHPEKSLQAR